MSPAPTQTAQTVELSEEARDRVAWYMDRTLQSLSALAGQNVKLICGHSITRQVLKELPDATLSWKFNTEPLAMDPSRIFYYKDNLHMTDLVPQDSGVYACVVTWGTDDTVKENLTLGVFSLEVETEGTSRYVFGQEPTKMDCHSVTLGELFPDAVRYWLFNGTHTRALPVTRASNRTCDVLKAANKSMSGVWECQVLHQRTARVWASAWYNITVQDGPTGADRAFRHIKDHFIIVIIVLSVLLLLLLIFFCFSAVKLKKMQDDVNEKFSDQRGGWEDLIIKHGVDGKIDVNKLTPPPSPKPSSEAENVQSLESTLDSDGPRDSKSGEADGNDGSEDVTESENDDESRNNFTWNNAYALHRQMKGYSGKRRAQVELNKAQMLAHFIGNSNENKGLKGKERNSKQALKFGRSLLAKKEERSDMICKATTSDALSWLNRYSKKAKRKGWDSDLKKYLPSQIEVDEKSSEKNQSTDRLIKEERSHTPTKTLSSGDQNMHVHGTHSSFNKKTNSGFHKNHGRVSTFNNSEFQDDPTADEEMWSYPSRPSARIRSNLAIFAGAASEANYSTEFPRDGGDHIKTYETTRNTAHSTNRISVKGAHGETTARGRQYHDMRVLQWKRWLSSKLPTTANRSSEASSKTMSWDNNEVMYTALPQNDDDYP